MSKKRGFEQLDGVSSFPQPKRRKICNGHTSKTEKEQKEEESLFKQLNFCMDLDDNKSITSVVESIESLESDTECINNDKENEEQCTNMLCKLQFNPNLIIPSNHFTQTICIFGGNYKILKLIISDITNNLLEIINNYNFKLHLINNNNNITNINNTNNNNTNENKSKLINTIIAQKLLENKDFNKIKYENNICFSISKYENCDICIVFPDNNINILCEIINFMKSPQIQQNENKTKLIGQYKKRILLVNIGGFFNGLRLQIMNFSSNDLPNPTNIVFVDQFNHAIQQLKQWNK